MSPWNRAACPAIRIRLLAPVAVAQASLAFCIMESLLASRDVSFNVVVSRLSLQRCVQGRPSCVPAWLSFATASRSLRNDFAVAKAVASGRALPLNSSFLRHCQQLLSLQRAGELARTLRCLGVAPRAPPLGSFLVILRSLSPKSLPTALECCASSTSSCAQGYVSSFLLSWPPWVALVGAVSGKSRDLNSL